MTDVSVAHVRRRVAAIKAGMDDAEVAHSDEDALHRDVLRAIAAGSENAADLAREALRTTALDFARWCA